jgi:hypothetical protein
MKLNIVFKLTYDLAIPLLAKYPRDRKTYILTKTCTQMLIETFVTDKRQKRHSTDERINKT